MKKSVKITLLVAAVLVGLGLCLSVVGFALGGRFSSLTNMRLDPTTGKWEQVDNAGTVVNDYDEGSYELPEGMDITALDIDWISGEVEVLVTDASAVSVMERVERGTSASYAMAVSEQDGVLKVRYTEEGFLNLPNLPSKKLVVHLPREVAENLKEVRLSSVSADFDVEALTFDDDFRDEEIAFVKADTVSVSTVSGKVELDGSFRRVTGESTSGEIDLTLRSCPEKLELTTVSGNIELELPEDAGFALDHSTVSGSLSSELRLNWKWNDLYTYGDSDSSEFTVSTTSGDLDIKKLEK